MAHRHNLIVDCDPGHDDAVAILLAYRHADLLGVTTVAGNAPLEHTTSNALALLGFIDAPVPVHSGADAPLAGASRDATHVHGKTGFGGVELPAPERTVASGDAVGFLIDQSRGNADLWIVAIGPLTNIAIAIRKDPDFARRIAGLSIMGGSTNAGNATPTAEFNIWADPEAAKVVFNSGARLKMCGLNLTRQFKTSDERLRQLRGSRAGELVGQLYAYMHTRMEELVGERRAALHDPCAVLALTHPHLFEFAQLHVDVEVEGELTRGMTVVDQRESRATAAPNADIGMRIDDEEAWALVVQTLQTYAA